MPTALSDEQLSSICEIVDREWTFAGARLTRSDYGTGRVLTADASWVTQLQLTSSDAEPVAVHIPLADGHPQPEAARLVESLGMSLTSQPAAVAIAFLERLRLQQLADGESGAPEPADDPEIPAVIEP